MSKGLFNWSSYTERKGDKITTPEKGKDTIPSFTKHKEKRVRVIRIYVKHRSGYIVGQLKKDDSLQDIVSGIFGSSNKWKGLKIDNGVYVNSNLSEHLERENMSSFYISASSIDFLEEGKGWLVEDLPEGDRNFEN